MKPILFLVLCLGLTACAGTSRPETSRLETSQPQASSPPDSLDAYVATLMETYKVTGIGIGRIQNGVLAWTRYYGEQASGVPVTRETMFNTASVAKAVTSETALRLVENGLLDLDEPISAHYIHPDIAEDPRHELLTPRLILTHKTGFLNWPYNYEDGTLAFVRDPGTAYGYSGIGFMILGRFLENKLGMPYPQIVRQYVFDPIGMDGASVVQEPWMTSRVTHPSDAEGAYFPDFELDLGYWNPADDLFVTVEDYAAFLISVMNGEGVGPELRAERSRVQTDLREDALWGCDGGAIDPCPDPYGHGIGWFVFGYDGSLNLQHGGNDEGEAANGYFQTDTKNGLVVFVNGANGVLVWPKIVDAVDDEQQFTGVFTYIIAKFLTPEE